MEFKIRRADRRHLAGINRLIVQTRISDPRKRLNGHFWFVRDNGQIIGCAGLEVISPQVAIFLHWAVDPAYRHHGLGTALLNHALDFAQQRGVKLVALATMYYHFRRFKKQGFETCPRKDLPSTVKDYWMFTTDRYKKCAVMFKLL